MGNLGRNAFAANCNHCKVNIVTSTSPTSLQVAEFLGSQNLDDLLGFLKGATPEAVPESAVPSFVVGQVMPNDIQVLPLGNYFCEKSVNAASVTVKVTVSNGSWGIIGN